MKRCLDPDLYQPHGSPPARGRGLKLRKGPGAAAAIESPPARGRGLKHDDYSGRYALLRRPPRGGVD